MNTQAAPPLEPLTALIYCRVSSTKQKLEGSGLASQEHRCRQYADGKGYAVEAVFPDDSSGGGDFMKRPGMRAMLAYFDAQKGTPYDHGARASGPSDLCGLCRGPELEHILAQGLS